MEPTLLVLAAGMGSRYGGLKQMDPMGPNGETVLDYSVYDAIRAGFKRVVFIIREDFAQAFREGVGARFDGKIEVDYVFQKLDDLPAGFGIPEGREKPWGTTHAIRAARHVVSGPFAVINADDFYGADAYQRIATYFKESAGSDDSMSHYCMVGYHINKTLSDHGDVNRGICADQDGLLTDVEEVTEIKREDDGKIYGNSLDGTRCEIPEHAVASMNFWGFNSEFFAQLEDHFTHFLEESGTEMKSECYIPTLVDELIRNGLADCRILETTSSWFGVTYPEDKPHVVSAIKRLVDTGDYPSPLDYPPPGHPDHVKPMKILITGGAGFIGSHIVEHFQGKADELRVLDNLRSGYKHNLDGFDCTVIEGSITDRDKVKEAVRDIDYIFHMAAMVSVPESMGNIAECVDINVKGLINVVEEASAAGVKKIVFASSAAVYGDNPTVPKVETMYPEPKSPYAITKLDGEYYLEMFRNTGKIQAASVRFFNVFGPRQDPNGAYAAAVPIFIEKAVNGEDLTIHGDGGQTRDFIYVKDIVNALAFAAMNEEMQGSYNAGYGGEITINDLANNILEMAATSSQIIHGPNRAGDVRHSRASSDKLHAAGWEPEYTLEQGLAATFEFFKKKFTS